MKFLKIFFLLLVNLVIFNLEASTYVGVVYNKKTKESKSIASEFKIQAIINFELRVKDIIVTKKKINKAVTALNNSGCSFIFTIGPDAALAGHKSGIPGAFCLVLDPVSLGLIDTNGIRTGQLRGILNDVEPEKQFKTVQNLVANRTHAVLITGPKTPNYLRNSFKDIWLKNGYRFVEEKIEGGKNIQSTFEKYGKSSHFILSAIDPNIYYSKFVGAILKASSEKNIPFIGFSNDHSKQGALISIYPELNSLGEQGVELIASLMSDDQKPDKDIFFSQKFEYSLNMKKAKQFGIKVPGSIRSGAQKVIGG